jgi:hypothetical protein
MSGNTLYLKIGVEFEFYSYDIAHIERLKELNDKKNPGEGRLSYDDELKVAKKFASDRLKFVGFEVKVSDDRIANSADDYKQLVIKHEEFYARKENCSRCLTITDIVS